MSPAQSATVQFYTGGSLDPSSPSDTLEKILATWSNRTLEARHDYIQHLFPLPERSPVNPDAPVITKEVRDAFLNAGNQGVALREGLQKAFGRMCRFYGFVLDESQGTIAKASNFDERAPDSWLTTIDHNHLRITRIIRCMRILGLQPPAHRFLIALLQADTHQTCSQNSVTFWCRAALWDLSKPPSYPRENVVKWLERDEEVKEECAGLDGEGEAEEIRQLAGERGVKV
ncbi:hypothetical protein KC343_g9113 [Hortaea werneckii]|nr:hypothetical protein KC323_g7614 [Hortaea werneckii]KAI6859596.1 hypothetical protein KC338_g7270 [Hortaea werneckii]KAI7190089.1 hypothetical protein KC352_g21805 [Hortaea werneckii]KAI7354886.1 hypothetical protein KC320_g3148 [Hortaea werneckii]KAI7555649.1 hypothetical protein KC317_g12805 [Hortaea werneckii]